MRLAIICPHFNWCNYSRPRENFCRFRESLGQPFTLCHARFADQTLDDRAVELLATTQNLMWQKESLINFAISRLPDQYDAVAWIDPDLLFNNWDWFNDTCKLLESHPVVQMFSYVRYLGPHGEEERLKPATAATSGDQASFMAPGGAIAVRREIVAALPLYDRHILGGGDQIFMDGCRGEIGRIARQMAPAAIPHVEHYAKSLYSLVQGDVVAVPGIVTHLWHGVRLRRRYQDRHAVLARRGYDPEKDVRLGPNGLLEWSSDNEPLHESAYGYFKQRKEDTIKPD